MDCCMRTYIATFFSHFGAIRFHKMLMQRGVSGKIKPVPRDLSSSCGTCVEFGMDWESNTAFPEPPGFQDNHAENTFLQKDFLTGEMEQIVEKIETGYRKVYEAENI